MVNLGNKDIFARNLNHYMERDGFTVKELSDKLKTPYTTVADWVKGNTYPRIDKIELMARLFEIEKSDLIEDKPIEPRVTPQRRFLLDTVKTATEEDIEKLAQVWKLITDEAESNY